MNFTGTSERTAKDWTHKVYQDGKLVKTRKSTQNRYNFAIVTKGSSEGAEWKVESFSGSKTLAESHARSISTPTKNRYTPNLMPARFKPENVLVVELTAL